MTDGDPRGAAREYLGGLEAVLGALPIDDVAGFIEELTRAYEQERQIFVVGNGGSAATASHLACDLGKTVLGKVPSADMKRFRVCALTDNMPLITAWGNDVCYERVFAEQLRNLGRQGDMLIVITGSGNSPNILEAVRAAREMGLNSMGLLGFEGGAVRQMLDRSVVIESDNYGYIEDVHMVLTHLITSHFARGLRSATGGARVSG